MDAEKLRQLPTSYLHVEIRLELHKSMIIVANKNIV